ncbi:PH domain-containing protein [Streptomyces sp. ACA25]|uniref:PH domain-containing protein n=1 Tax=Streptomyces sp. ACA25 TaxID=3022596 RepID=UPI002307A7BA|nr:PH domain-containing protein [Streptomyces sp. ACA25]MDB1087039.1 PH domain-containing protein [Streptomyces sp. ACA25]
MTSDPQEFADRSYRSGSAVAGGVLILGIAAWLGGDAMLRGEGRTPLVAVAALLFAVPLIVAFSVRPAVFAGGGRMRVRNPFRTIEAPWATVESIRAGYSCELVADGRKYQLWAIPVSLRARNKVNRHNRRIAGGESPRSGPFGMGGAAPEDAHERTAPSDAAVHELRELSARHRDEEAAQGPVTIRWAYEILAPAALGAVALFLLWLTA